MEVIRSASDIDMNSNLFKEKGYWSHHHSNHRHGKPGSSSNSSNSHDGNHSEEWKNGAVLGSKSAVVVDIDDDFMDLYDMESPEISATVRAVSLRLEKSLRAAKKAHLSCGEVLLPPDLLSRVARDIIKMAETEPYGLRGCLILLNFENGSASSATSGGRGGVGAAGTSSEGAHKKELHSSNSSLSSNSSCASSEKASSSSGSNLSNLINNTMTRNIGRIRCDSQTLTTFELHLTLREDTTPWYSRLPQILRNLTKGGTICISSAYVIVKKKLYRSH